MPRFNTNTFRSLNESIARIQNPQAALDEAMEYTALLETVLLALCEELDLDPNKLFEDIQTPERAEETQKARKEAGRKHEKLLQKAFRAGENEGSPKIRKIDSDYSKVAKRDFKEKSDPDRLYGKGGKVVGRYKSNVVGAAGIRHQKKFDRMHDRTKY